MVVEDDPDVRTYVADMLGSLGYDVLQAESGEQALVLSTNIREQGFC